MLPQFQQLSMLRKFSLDELARLTDAEILQLFRTARWGKSDNPNEVVCPQCGKRHIAYWIRARQQWQWQWQCKHCQRRFSVTSGTVFANHKISLRKILICLFEFAIAAKGISATRIAAILGIQHKHAWALLHKLCDNLNSSKDLSPLNGEVHIDGGYFNYHIRPKNFKHKRIDRRAKRNQRQDKSCVLVFRQKSADYHKIKGADRTIVAQIKEENTQDMLALTRLLVKQDSEICADENPAYNNLNFHYNRWSVNHQEAYSAKGVNNNLVESFNARFRDLHRGVHHKTDNKYALHYANQVAFMSDNRRKSNGELFSDVLQRCLWVLPLKEWVGYWQGNHRQGELIGMKAFAPEEISQNYFKRLEEQMKYDEMLLAA